MPHITNDFAFADVTQKHVGRELHERITKELGSEATPEQTRALYLQKGSEYIREITKDPWVFPNDFSGEMKERLEEIGKTVNPYYEPLSEKEKKARSEEVKRLREKYTEYAAMRLMNQSAVKIPANAVGNQRVASAFLYVGNTPEIFDKNDALIARLMNPDPEVRKAAFMDRIREIADKNIPRIDLADPRSISEHIAELGEVVAVGAETDKLNSMFREEEDYELLEQANVMFETASIMRFAIDVYTSPLHAEVRTEDLSDLGPKTSYWDLSGDEDNIIRDQPCPEKGIERGANFYFRTLSSMNSLHGKSPLLDTAKTPAQRIDSFRANLWKKDIKSFDVKPNAEWQGLDSQWTRDYKDQERKLRARIPELREKLEKNLKKLEALDPKFALTEEEKDRMFSEENIQLSIKARAMQERAVQINKSAIDVAMPKNVIRILHGFVKTDDKNDREKEEEIQAFQDLMNSDTPEAANRRKQMVIDKLNRIGTIDPKKIDLSKPIAESAKEAMDNYDLFNFAFELPNFKAGLADSFGLSPKNPQELAAYVKRGQSLGTDGLCVVSELADDLFFTLPLDRMTGIQMTTIAEDLLKDGNITQDEHTRLVTYGYNKLPYENPNYAEEMKPFETQLEMDALRYPQEEAQLKNAYMDDARSPEKRFSERLTDRLQALSKENSLFGFTDSIEFVNLKKNLTQAEKMMRDQLAADDRQPVDETMKNRLEKSVREYISHVTKQEGGAKNARQSRRLEIANQLLQNLEDFNREKTRLGDRMRTEAGIADETRAAREQNEEMQLYEKGIRRTDEMIREQQGRDKSGIEYMLNDRMIEARGEIANQSGRTEPDAGKVSENVSAVLAAQLLMNQKDALAKMQEQLPAEKFREKLDMLFARMKENVQSNPLVSERLKQMDGHALNQFLAGSGERELTDLYVRSDGKDMQKSSIAPERSRSLSTEKKGPEAPSIQ